MKFLIQRVQKANVKVDNKIIGAINKGLVVFVGISNTDTIDTADYLVKKLINLRIFPDNNHNMNISIKDSCGEILIISQFTLYANCNSGNRPSFVEAAKADYAKELYDYVIKKCKEHINIVEEGEFGAEMQVELINDGPVTIMMEKNS